MFLHTYFSLYKLRHWNDCPWKLGALCATKVISCWHTTNGTWWVWTEEIVETIGGCWLQLLPGDVAGDQHGAWALHLGPSQFHVSYYPRLRVATSQGQEEGNKPNFSSAPHPLLGLFSQSYDQSCIHWKIFIKRLLWTRLWTSSNHEHIQGLENHVIKMYNYYFSHQRSLINHSQFQQSFISHT